MLKSPPHVVKTFYNVFNLYKQKKSLWLKNIMARIEYTKLIGIDCEKPQRIYSSSFDAEATCYCDNMCVLK